MNQCSKTMRHFQFLSLITPFNLRSINRGKNLKKKQFVFELTKELLKINYNLVQCKTCTSIYCRFRLDFNEAKEAEALRKMIDSWY